MLFNRWSEEPHVRHAAARPRRNRDGDGKVTQDEIRRAVRGGQKGRPGKRLK